MNRVLLGCSAAALAAMVVIYSGCDRQSPVSERVTAVAPPLPRIERGRVHFVEGYAEGLRRAQALDKPMLLFFTADWCEYCNAMAQDALCEEAVVSLSERFVCVLIDVDAEPQVCQKFEVLGYPTVQFVSSMGAPLNRVVGKQPASQLAMEMQAALQAVARRNVRTDEARAF